VSVASWGNPRWRRLLTWMMRWPSPSIGRVPTFREAWTGDIVSIDVDGMMGIGLLGPDEYERQRKARQRRFKAQK